MRIPTSYRSTHTYLMTDAKFILCVWFSNKTFDVLKGQIFYADSWELGHKNYFLPDIFLTTKYVFINALPIVLERFLIQPDQL